MVDVLQWLTYSLAISAIGLGFLWFFWTSMSASLGEDVRKLEPPHGVELGPVERHAIFEELYRRRRMGIRTAAVVYVLVIVALHPMYTPDRLSDGAYAAAWGVALLGGHAIGETYAATRAARTTRPDRRLATLTPRNGATYLPAFERVAQLVLVCVLPPATAVLTVATVATDPAAWVTYAAYVCWAWLIATVAALAGQRWVLAQTPPLDDDRALIVREYVTATAMQQLHKVIWVAGLLAYITTVGYALGAEPTGPELVVGYAPAAAILFGVIGLWRWRELPDPTWHFARAAGSPA